MDRFQSYGTRGTWQSCSVGTDTTRRQVDGTRWQMYTLEALSLAQSDTKFQPVCISTSMPPPRQNHITPLLPAFQKKPGLRNCSMSKY
jgi:hypothetical protein